MFRSVGKRFFDIIITVLSALLLIPVFFIAALIVYVGDGRPIFYMQNRIGKNSNFFKLYKFRTMKLNSDKEGSVTHKDDDRIIAGGTFLRTLKIDELPQIFNVIEGSMSLVGPRPTVLDDYEKMSEEQKQRTKVLPGLTGLAQISGNTSLSWPQRIELDLEYIDKLSFLLDVKIIILTFFKILGNKIDSNPPSEGEWS